MNGSLTLVATPIGNLADLSVRAIETLNKADVIACEDTRHTRKLLTHHGIASTSLVALHEHNEVRASQQLVDMITSGRNVVLVSDAGMPAISDPGERLVSAVIDAGLPVSVIPGASAVIAAVAVSGLPTARFCFEGFLPRKGADRRKLLAELAKEERTLVFYESPHRIGEVVVDMTAAFGSGRRVTLVRELTKIHEEIQRSTLAELSARLGSSPLKGECVLVVEGAPKVKQEVTEQKIEAALRLHLDAGASKKDAAAHVAEELSISKRDAYEVANRI